MLEDFANAVEAAIEEEDVDVAIRLTLDAMEGIEQQVFDDYEALESLLSTFWNDMVDVDDEVQDSVENTLNGDSGGTVGLYLGENPLDNDQLIKALFKVALETQDVNLLCIVANNPSCPALYLREIAKSEDGWEENSPRQTVARNANCPTDLLAELSLSIESCERFAVATNPRCPSEILERLAQDLGVSTSLYYDENFPEYKGVVAYAVAGNSNTPRATLEKMALGDLPDLGLPLSTDTDYRNRLYGIDEPGSDEILKAAIAEQASKTVSTTL